MAPWSWSERHPLSSVHYIRPSGSLVGPKAQPFIDEVRNLIPEGLLSVVVDLRDTEFLTKGAVQILRTTSFQLRDLGGGLVVFAPSKMIRGLFKLHDPQGLVPIFESELQLRSLLDEVEPARVETVSQVDGLVSEVSGVLSPETSPLCLPAPEEAPPPEIPSPSHPGGSSPKPKVSFLDRMMVAAQKRRIRESQGDIPAEVQERYRLRRSQGVKLQLETLNPVSLVAQQLSELSEPPPESPPELSPEEALPSNAATDVLAPEVASGDTPEVDPETLSQALAEELELDEVLPAAEERSAVQSIEEALSVVESEFPEERDASLQEELVSRVQAAQIEPEPPPPEFDAVGIQSALGMLEAEGIFGESLPSAEPVPEPVPELAPAREPEAHAATPREMSREADPKVRAEAVFRAEAEPEVEADPDPELLPKFEPESEPETRVEPQAEPETRAELRAELEPEPETRVEPQAELESEPETRAGLRAEPEPEPETRVEPRAQPERELETPAEPEPAPNLGIFPPSQVEAEGGAPEFESRPPFAPEGLARAEPPSPELTPDPHPAPEPEPKPEPPPRVPPPAPEPPPREDPEPEAPEPEVPGSEPTPLRVEGSLADALYAELEEGLDEADQDESDFLSEAKEALEGDSTPSAQPTFSLERLRTETESEAELQARAFFEPGPAQAEASETSEPSPREEAEAALTESLGPEDSDSQASLPEPSVPSSPALPEEELEESDGPIARRLHALADPEPELEPVSRPTLRVLEEDEPIPGPQAISRPPRSDPGFMLVEAPEEPRPPRPTGAFGVMAAKPQGVPPLGQSSDRHLLGSLAGQGSLDEIHRRFEVGVDSPRERWMLVRRLGKLGGEESLDLLQSLTEDPDGSVRAMVQGSLRRIQKRLGETESWARTSHPFPLEADPEFSGSNPELPS